MSGDHNMHQNDFHPDWDTVKAFDERHNEDTALLQQCLEVLERYSGIDQRACDVEEAVQKRLEQTAMQPCAGRNCGSTNPNLHSAECFEDYEKSTGMRKWVGLTDDEIKEIIGPWGDTPIKGYTRELFNKIEAKLKEKNG
jgi:hypothetical protein